MESPDSAAGVQVPPPERSPAPPPPDDPTPPAPPAALDEPAGEPASGSTRADLPPWPLLASAAAWAIILGGVALRVLRYRANRSLWLDEAMLALNIVQRSMGQLLEPLKDEQGAPIGFLWAVKAATLAIGPNELGMRLVPLLSGIVALVAVYLVLRRAVRWEGALVGVALFAMAESGLYYSSEVKQYATDAAAAALALLAGVRVLRGGYTRANVALLVAVGVLAPWFSHPSLFVLAGLGATLFVRSLLARRAREALLVSGIGASWLAAFGVLYVVSLRHLLDNPYYTEFWDRSFLPFPPRGIGDLRLYATGFFGAFPDSLGVSHFPGHELIQISALAATLWVVGCYYLISRRQWMASLLILPVLVTMAASMARSYPFANRLLVFLSPLFVVGIAAAFGWLMDMARTRADRRGAWFLAAGALALPVVVAAAHLRPPPPRQEVRDAVLVMKREARPDDHVFTNNRARVPYEFYRRHFQMPELTRIPSRDMSPDADKVLPLVDALASRGGRVWVLLGLTHPYTDKGDTYLDAHLQQRGRRLLDSRGPMYRLSLYDFTGRDGTATTTFAPTTSTTTVPR